MKCRLILLLISITVMVMVLTSCQQLIRDIGNLLDTFESSETEQNISKENESEYFETQESEEQSSKEEISELESSESEESQTNGSEEETSELEGSELEESEEQSSKEETSELESSESEESQTNSSEEETSELESSELEESEESSSKEDTSETESSESEEGSSEEETSGTESSESEESEQENSGESLEKELQLSIPNGLRVGYIVYDVKSDHIISSFNTNDDFRTGCTIKAAYVLWLLKTHPDLSQEWDTTKLTYYKTKEGTSVWRDQGVKDGTKFQLSKVLEYAIKYSDNDAYIMLTSKYAYAEFNSFMEKLGVSIRLGSYTTGYNFTSATAEEQLIIWKEIINYCFEDISTEAQAFKSWLLNAYYDFIERIIKQETLHMSGWAPGSGTINDCAIVLDEEGKPEKIIILLTSDGKKVEKMNMTAFYNLVSQMWEQIE